MSKLIIYCLKLFTRLILLNLLFYLFFPVEALAVDWQKYSGNPIFRENLSGWDSYHVHSPDVLKLDNTYNLWYVANGGPGWRIGYASSSGGLTNWIRSSDPVIPPGSVDDWENETNDPSVIYDSSNSIYKMWFTSANADHWQSGPDRFRTRYATSLDGINWTKLNWVLMGTPGSWDSGGTARGRSVIYNNGVYHMWYAATNENDLGSNPFWRIGYATSTNGLTWIKQNNGNPVLSPSSAWELNNLSFPAVLFSNGLYHMWYGASTGDIPIQIVYAYSFDGINWVKPSELNPVLTGTPGTFDQTNIFPSTIIKEDILKMWYSGFGADGHWRIGYATANANILPTERPNAVSTSKVVIIPGFGGTWNNEAIWNCTLDPTVGTWGLTNFIGVTNPYPSLANEFSNRLYDPKIFLYDWRLQATTSAEQLAAFIESGIERTNNERVHVVGHSFGGLVAITYFDKNWWRQKIDHLLTIGSPHNGTVIAYPAWSGGDIWWNDIMQRVVLTSIIKLCATKNGKTDRQTIQTIVPSVQNMLPRFNFLINDADKTYKPVNSMDAKNNLHIQTLFSPLWGTTIKTLSGTSFDTLQDITVKDANKHDLKLGNWIDGKPFKTDTTLAGDGTVLIQSSQLIGDGIENRTINQNHQGLITSGEGVNTILDLLDIQTSTVQSTVSTSPTTALVLIGYSANFTVRDPQGYVADDKDGFIGFLNPKKGLYRVRLKPTGHSMRFVVAQFLENGKTLWKEYSQTDVAAKQGLVPFDPENPVEDTLQ